MAIPADKSKLDPVVIDYLRKLVDSDGKDNPYNLQCVACFFAGKEAPRVYHSPHLTVQDLAETEPVIDDEKVRNLKRLDTVVSAGYVMNPTCSWVFVNGRHRVYCG